MVTSTNIQVRGATLDDAPACAALYNHYITDTVISFEEEPVRTAEFAARIDEILRIPLPWLVAEQDGRILGYAHASKWKGRCAYRFSFETSVYVAYDCGRRGIGSLLYAELLRLLDARGNHSVIGGIALPNAASVALHEKFGFQKVAHFREVGFKFDSWHDVGYWQRMESRDPR
jgi:phosphinothricin acetyltransferase